MYESDLPWQVHLTLVLYYNWATGDHSATRYSSILLGRSSQDGKVLSKLHEESEWKRNLYGARLYWRWGIWDLATTDFKTAQSTIMVVVIHRLFPTTESSSCMGQSMSHEESKSRGTKQVYQSPFLRPLKLLPLKLFIFHGHHLSEAKTRSYPNWPLPLVSKQRVVLLGQIRIWTINCHLLGSIRNQMRGKKRIKVITNLHYSKILSPQQDWNLPITSIATGDEGSSSSLPWPWCSSDIRYRHPFLQPFS